ncbi:MAG: AAA family ATPase [Phycisphaerae bacterium]|nr:AAA family ATPase [Phycisphaerae bacterium]
MTPVRARSLNDILGQERAVATLRASIASGRVHHAWVFAGPAGVGKRTTAEAFAAAILDPTTRPNLGGEWEPDPESVVQRLIAQGKHPDLHVITKELARFDDDRKVRERKLLSIPKEVIGDHLLEPIVMAASMRGDSLASKVFIIDEAELLDRSRTNATTQNSMLKTLEEPPTGSVIILVTSAEERLLPTIRSRCQRVVFDSLPREAMEKWLDRSGLKVRAEERGWLLEFAQGSPGRATLAVDGGMFEWARTLEPMLEESERGRFSASLGSTMAGLVEAWAKKWVEDHKNASKEAANLAGTRHLLGLLAERERRRLREAAGERDRLERSLRVLDLIEKTELYVASSVTIANSMEALAAGMAER